MTTEYDGFASAYAAENERSLFNTYDAHPEMLRLSGEVSGRRILDVGCGSGPLTEALQQRGADVTGLDASAAMIELARQRLGDGVDLRVADLADPLPFVDAEFDGRPVDLTYWHRLLSAVTDAFTAAGFRIGALSEPPLAADTPADLLPEGEPGQAFICFLFFVLDQPRTEKRPRFSPGALLRSVPC